MSEESVINLLKYTQAGERVESARNLHNYASSKLTIAEIEERFHELVSQHDPINESLESIGFDNKQVHNLVRAEILHFCRYVVTGRKDRII